MNAAVTVGAVLPGLLVAHHVADHWVQTGHQALHKADEGWSGRWACARHVTTYTVCTATVVGVLWAVLDLAITPAGFLAGQVLSAVTHYVADRRSLLGWLADVVGKREMWRLGGPRASLTVRAIEPSPYGHSALIEVPLDQPHLGTGAYQLDQSWHLAWLLVAALVTALIGGAR